MLISSRDNSSRLYQNPIEQLCNLRELHSNQGLVIQNKLKLSNHLIGHNVLRPVMTQVLLEGVPNRQRTIVLAVDLSVQIKALLDLICVSHHLQTSSFYLTHSSKSLSLDATLDSVLDPKVSLVVLRLKSRLLGGIDFQHREGSKVGSGGMLSNEQAAIGKRERLRKLALETIDLQKDPYFMRNHLGSYECKLCLTLHPNEGNYLAHTQGKRHQSNLGRRAALDAKNEAAPSLVVQETKKRKTMKIGRPGYKVSKGKDVQTNQKSLKFEIDYPEADDNTQPRHRFMSAYEQKVELPDKKFQYVLFACEPYETIAFKIPNLPVDKHEGRFFTTWDAPSKKFILSLSLLNST